MESGRRVPVCRAKRCSDDALLQVEESTGFWEEEGRGLGWEAEWGGEGEIIMMILKCFLCIALRSANSEIFERELSIRWLKN